ncbi:hypothetical protein [Neptuniibacter sp. QD37_11]|uniref:hypothetical protein n=1 Tax=Neptuniibacter sp. QD37_11 TaxID=3398209 RepID=UPI0039F61B5B
MIRDFIGFYKLIGVVFALDLMCYAYLHAEYFGKGHPILNDIVAISTLLYVGVGVFVVLSLLFMNHVWYQYQFNEVVEALQKSRPLPAFARNLKEGSCDRFAESSGVNYLVKQSHYGSLLIAIAGLGGACVGFLALFEVVEYSFLYVMGCILSIAAASALALLVSIACYIALIEDHIGFLGNCLKIILNPEEVREPRPE